LVVVFNSSSRTSRRVLAIVAILFAQHVRATWMPVHVTARAAAQTPLAIIDTIAGGGPVGDRGPATSARFNLPGGVTEAPNGDLVIVDFGNHRLRRIDHRTGIIDGLAGTGEAGYNGDGIPASRAQLARPEYAVFDAAGDLFIADSYNNRVRKIDHLSGVISTVAGTGERGASGDGGSATAAELHFPEGIAVDIWGNLFIADTVNRRIRRVDARTGIITTYAGTGEVGGNAEGTPASKARFLRLARIAVDRAGNVYVADSPSHHIWIIDAATRTVHALLGTGTPGFSGDGGPATAAQVSFPEGIAIAPNGDAYFADVGNHRVRKVDARTGIIATVAGTGEKGFSGDGGPATAARLWSPGRVWVDRAGNVLIADILNARIRRLDARTGTIATVAGTGDWGDGGPARDALLSVPGDVVYADGKVYIADYGTRRVRCVDLASGVISTVAGGGTRASGDGIPATEADLLLPEGIAVDSRRGLHIADNISNRVWKVDLATGILRAFAGGGRTAAGLDGPAVSAGLTLPSALSVGPDGMVYIADFGSHRVRVVDPAGMMHTLPGTNGADPLDLAITSLEATTEGLFMLVHGSKDVRLFDPRRHAMVSLPRIDTVPPPPSGDSQIIDLAVHGPHVYLADALAHRVLDLDRRSSTVRVIAGSGVQGFSGDGGPADRASFFQPGGVAVSDDGRQLFIADTKNHRIRRVRLLDAEGSK
jgi:sugar lactone lactonase YvrE